MSDRYIALTVFLHWMSENGWRRYFVVSSANKDGGNSWGVKS